MHAFRVNLPPNNAVFGVHRQSHCTRRRDRNSKFGEINTLSVIIQRLFMVIHGDLSLSSLLGNKWGGRFQSVFGIIWRTSWLAFRQRHSSQTPSSLQHGVILNHFLFPFQFPRNQPKRPPKARQKQIFSICARFPSSHAQTSKHQLVPTSCRILECWNVFDSQRLLC